MRIFVVFLAMSLLVGCGEGKFYPLDVTSDYRGNIYVMNADTIKTLGGTAIQTLEHTEIGIHRIKIVDGYIYVNGEAWINKFALNPDEGWRGSFNLGFFPTGFAVKGDKFYVAGKDVLLMFDDEDVQTIETPYGVNYPRDIDVDSDGNIYVADTDNHRIQKFTPDGKFLMKWGIEGSDDGEFDGPCGIAISLLGNVYVADTGNHRIQKFTPDGKFLMKWGTEGNGRGEFHFSHGLDVDVFGRVYVADAGNRRIQQFNSEGVFLKMWK